MHSTPFSTVQYKTQGTECTEPTEHTNNRQQFKHTLDAENSPIYLDPFNDVRTNHVMYHTGEPKPNQN